MAASVTAVQEYTGPSTLSFAPLGSATGSSGSTNTTALTCTPCCAPSVSFLDAWFGPSGLCPGAVDNSVPVTLNASFSLAITAPYSTLGTYCLPSTGTASLVANNYSQPNLLYWSSPAACSTVSSPTTRFQPTTTNICYLIISGGKLRSQYPLICGCSNGSQIALNMYDMTASAYSCSPFSITFTGGYLAIFSTIIGTYSVTFTL